MPLSSSPPEMLLLLVCLQYSDRVRVLSRIYSLGEKIGSDGGRGSAVVGWRYLGGSGGMPPPPPPPPPKFF